MSEIGRDLGRAVDQAGAVVDAVYVGAKAVDWIAVLFPMVFVVGLFALILYGGEALLERHEARQAERRKNRPPLL